MGTRCCGRIRALATPDGVPAIALTGYTRAEDKQRVLAAGFVAHVPKPVQPEVLVKVLGDVVGRRTPGSQLH
jgi:CheY-like chemotaxis protein